MSHTYFPVTPALNKGTNLLHSNWHWTEPHIINAPRDLQIHLP